MIPGVVSPTAAAPQMMLRQACADFEALFLTQLFGVMRQTVQKNELFSGGRAESMFQDMQDSAIAQATSAGTGLGLAQMLYQQLVPAVNGQKL